ncbi:AAA family ATPase, partial [Micromonospora sp. ATA32]|nr:AAA family ATPase [Micromonospora sp. ATA32]
SAPLVAATDASWKGRAGGIGYVVSDGHYGLLSRGTGRLDPTGVSRVLINELRAVDFLLSAYDEAPAGMTVLLDNLTALRYLHRWQAGETGAMPAGYSLRPRKWTAQPTLVRLAELVGQRPDLSFAHVKGHTGHALNEAADGLSHMARRRLEESFDMRPRAHALVDAFLRDWHATVVICPTRRAPAAPTAALSSTAHPGRRHRRPADTTRLETTMSQQPTGPLIELIFDRLAADGVPDDTAEVVLAALGGDDDLAAALAGTPTSLDLRSPAADEPDKRIWLTSVTVAGFRGVGPERTVEIGPGPGITLVVGRNGSGKSSFAEAVELALTGDSARWADRNSVWRTGWRNLHTPDPCRIAVELRVDGVAAPDPGGARLAGRRRVGRRCGDRHQ